MLVLFLYFDSALLSPFLSRRKPKLRKGRTHSVQASKWQRRDSGPDLLSPSSPCCLPGALWLLAGPVLFETKTSAAKCQSQVCWLIASHSCRVGWMKHEAHLKSHMDCWVTCPSAITSQRFVLKINYSLKFHLTLGHCKRPKALPKYS